MSPGAAGVSRPAVWRWQQRYAEQGIHGLLRDKTRKPGREPLPPEGTVARSAGTALLASARHRHALDGSRCRQGGGGVSLRAVQRIWESPPASAASPAHFQDVGAIPLLPRRSRMLSACTWERRPAMRWCCPSTKRAQIQALDRTQPGLPLKLGKCATMTHDYKRNGTTTLFAALNILDGTVLGRCMDRAPASGVHGVSSMRWRRAVAGWQGSSTPSSTTTPAHKHPKVRKWLANHPRWVFHLADIGIPGSTPSKDFFSPLTRRRLKRGVFRSIVDLQAAINRYLAEHNARRRDPSPGPRHSDQHPRQAEPSECVCALDAPLLVAGAGSRRRCAGRSGR